MSLINSLCFISRDRFRPATKTAVSIPGLRRISSQTVRNRLYAAGLRARRPAVRVVLRPHHRRARLTWARAYARWSRVQWRTVVFSDESRFCLQAGDGRVRVWRRPGERFSDNCIREQDKHRGGSVMVWGAIDLQEKSDLIIVDGTLNAEQYLEQVINPTVVPLFVRRPNLVFMHDNARPHAARLTTAHLANMGIPVIPWPSKSPDLNPIEHLWDELERRIRNRPNLPTSLQQLQDALLEEWEAIPREVWRKLIFSMRKRCQAVVTAYGGHTRY